jgi:hypothetical protein
MITASRLGLALEPKGDRGEHDVARTPEAEKARLPSRRGCRWTGWLGPKELSGTARSTRAVSSLVCTSRKRSPIGLVLSYPSWKPLSVRMT